MHKSTDCCSGWFASNFALSSCTCCSLANWSRVPWTISTGPVNLLQPFLITDSDPRNMLAILPAQQLQIVTCKIPVRNIAGKTLRPSQCFSTSAVSVAWLTASISICKRPMSCYVVKRSVKSLEARPQSQTRQCKSLNTYWWRYKNDCHDCRVRSCSCCKTCAIRVPATLLVVTK